MSEEFQGELKVIGARENNLKNIDVTIPHNALTVITGLSGSGKSSLAFNTIYAEGQRRYIDTFSPYARNMLGNVQRPDVDSITGLCPVISIEQKTLNRNPRSTVGTTTEVYDFLRLLFARAGHAVSWQSGKEMTKFSEEQIVDLIIRRYSGRRIYVLAPLVKNRKGQYRELFDNLAKKGFLYVRIDGKITELSPKILIDRYSNHSIELVIDRLVVAAEDETRIAKTISEALARGDKEVMIYDPDADEVSFYSQHLVDPDSGLSYRDPAPHNFSFNSPQGYCPRCKGLGYIDPEESDNADASDMQTSAHTTLLCPECHGDRLNREALHFFVDGKNIADLASMDIAALLDWTQTLLTRLDRRDQAIAAEIVKEISSRLQFLIDVGLGYLQLNRASATLSGGESQRIRLASQLGSQLVNVLYILDEPSIGLHQRDNHKLIRALKQLRDASNTIIVVEHDRDIMLQSDYIVDIGPGAGKTGGHIVFAGTPEQLLHSDTLTARFLNGTLSVNPRAEGGGQRSAVSGQQSWLTLVGCTGHNLKNVTLRIPLGTLSCIAGVSGSGKSSLVNDTLVPILERHFYRATRQPLPYSEIHGVEQINKVITVDQSPLGRSPRSNPATYTGLFTEIRTLFQNLPEAKIRGYKPGRFSFNVAGGRCEACAGNGYKTIEMNFLPDVLVPCQSCHGKRYNRETLEVRFKGKSIADVLDMTIAQATEFFANVPKILNKLKTLNDIGLGYIKLGQPSATLSGGENQRVKLAAELARPHTGKTLFVLDEPTTGLHFQDIRNLLNLLYRLREKGNTVLVIEHNTDVLNAADYLIEMGPDGGSNGGQIISAHWQ